MEGAYTQVLIMESLNVISSWLNLMSTMATPMSGKSTTLNGFHHISLSEKYAFENSNIFEGLSPHVSPSQRNMHFII